MCIISDIKEILKISKSRLIQNNLRMFKYNKKLQENLEKILSKMSNAQKKFFEFEFKTINDMNKKMYECYINLLIAGEIETENVNKPITEEIKEEKNE